MRRVRLVAVTVLLCAALVMTPGVAPAGSPGTWTRVTWQDARNIDEVALHRTPDGRLHVFWVRRAPDNDHTLLGKVFSASGEEVLAYSVTDSWHSVGDPDVVAEGSGMRVFFGGFRSGERDDPVENLVTLSAPAAPTQWTATEGTVADADQAYAGEVGAANALDGTPFQSWAVTGGTFVHRGLDPATPNHDFQEQFGGCCGGAPDLATDQATGRMWLGWHGGSRERPGLYVNEVDTAMGAPVGQALLMPGTATEYEGRISSLFSNARTPITSRPGRPGVYVAYAGGYPVGKRVLVWRVGAGSSTTVARHDRHHQDIGIAADPHGRLWVMWTEERVRDRPRIYARRSNPSVTRWGHVVSIRPPAETSTVWKLVGNAQATKLDAVAMVTTADGLAGWHTQLRPGLTLDALPRRFEGSRNVSFTVTDAGVPVKDALVRAAGESELTNSSGVATLVLGPYDRDRQIVATASKAWFVADSLELFVRQAN